jgi:hypothetical protein
VQFDGASGTAKPATADELVAYERLVARYRRSGAADLPVRVTGLVGSLRAKLRN